MYKRQICISGNEGTDWTDGRIENQTKDLFDQFDLDLNKMIGLWGKKNGVNPE